MKKENLSGTNTLFKEKEIFFDLTNRYTNQPIRKENIDGSPYLLMQFLSKKSFLILVVTHLSMIHSFIHHRISFFLVQQRLQIVSNNNNKSKTIFYWPRF